MDLFYFFNQLTKNVHTYQLEEINQLNAIETIKRDLRRITANSSICTVSEVVNKENEMSKIKVKTPEGKFSIFIKAFTIGNPLMSRFDTYDQDTNKFLKCFVLKNAHISALADVVKNIPRAISQKNSTIRFPKDYQHLFKRERSYKNFFGYNPMVEFKLSRSASAKQLENAKNKLYNKYGKASQRTLRIKVFENSSTSKLTHLPYLSTKKFVNVYYNVVSDRFAIIDEINNTLIDFGIGNKVLYAQVFATKALLDRKDWGQIVDDTRQIAQQFESSLQANPSPISVQKFQSRIMPYYEARAMLNNTYGCIEVETGNG